MEEIRKQRRNFSKQNYKIDSISMAKIDDIEKSANKIAEKEVRDEE